VKKGCVYRSSLIYG